MKEVAWMAGISVVTWLAASASTGAEVSAALFYGMIGPLVVACGTWIMVERVFRQDPQSLMPWMVGGFAFKLVFFGAYVAIMIRVVGLSPVPFVVGFSSYFIALHFTEALLLRRLFGARRA
ncbi:MAG: ATP synthase subunit I [Vicinamibacterales bacterium]